MRTKPSEHDRKFFLCTGQVVKTDQLMSYPKSHIVGELRYVAAFHDKPMVSALALYEASRPVHDVPEKMPEIRIDIVGNAVNIQCTCCYHKRRWSIGRSALLQLISRFDKSFA